MQWQITHENCSCFCLFVIILVAMQRWKKDAGIGNLIAMMLPYSITFAIAWTLLLIGWSVAGWELGPGAPLWYTPAAAE